MKKLFIILFILLLFIINNGFSKENSDSKATKQQVNPVASPTPSIITGHIEEVRPKICTRYHVCKVIIPTSEEGRSRFPRLIYNITSFFRFVEVKEEVIKEIDVKDIMDGRIFYKEVYAFRPEYINFKDLFRADSLLSMIKSLDMYTLTEKKSHIINEILKLHQDYLNEFKSYLNQSFETKPENTIIYEKYYDFDSQSIHTIGMKSLNDDDHEFKIFMPYSLEKAKKLFSMGEGEIGSREIKCTRVRYIKFNSTKCEITVVREEFFSKSGDILLAFDYNF